MRTPVLAPGTSKLPGTQGTDTQVRSLSAAAKPDVRARHAAIAGTGALPLPQPWTLPPHGLAVFHGETPRLSHYFLPRLLLEGKRVLFLDGANCADPRLLERLARQRGVPFEQFNRQIQIARAFTCFQLTELIARVPQFLADFPAQVLIVTAFPELYFDEDVRDWDARVAFAQALASLQRWARMRQGMVKTMPRAHELDMLRPSGPEGITTSAAKAARKDAAFLARLKARPDVSGSSPLTVAVFSAAPNHSGLAPSPARRRFFHQLCATANEVWKFTRGEDNRLGLTCERAIVGATPTSPLHESWQRAAGRGGLCPHEGARSAPLPS